ncbi:MAG: hypothetical protein CVU48_06525 [Candidatus Cloacimonetes bacterium HGW-Cloacimonetes-1]|jgi:hypothetical protein|nr:MAG: hypothetical protein CVU48_06525 [Candidatus Cloacimonetes bacterium HGW-Cloacimonetes-1]
MKRILLILCLILVGKITALTWTVKPDGSGQFSTIQAAIDASSHTDSIRVYPGIYVENIDYSGKNILIYSLEYSTGNPAYRDSTIIDGNRNGSVVKSILATSNCGIYGFTIRNGSGDIDLISQGVTYRRGGGLRLRNAASFTIAYCNIKDNICDNGGGIFLRDAIVYTKGCDVSNNFALLGGGILINTWGRIYFDPIQRSSVYNNIAGGGQDIIAADTRLDMDVYLDMGTVGYHNDYYVVYSKSITSFNGTLLGVDIQRGYLNEIDADLYVAPDGSDLNDGLSPLSPLKCIYRAIQMVQSDSLNPKTVHLAPGDYSSEYEQFYPIGLKSHVKLLGAGIGVTNLVNSRYILSLLGRGVINPEVEGMSLRQDNNSVIHSPINFGQVVNGKLTSIYIDSLESIYSAGITLGSFSYYYSNCVMKDVTIYGNSAVIQTGIFANVVDLDIDGLTIDNCHVTGAEIDFPSSVFYFSANKLRMSNSAFVNNSVNYNDINILSIGFNGEASTRSLKLDNVLVANNHTTGEMPVFIANFNENPAILNNCTFANNSGANFAVKLNGNFIVNNCIFDNDTPAEIMSLGATSQIQFNNNFIRNYPNSTSFAAINNVSFNDVVLSGDPGFCGRNPADPLSYRLGNGSICRDIGIMDTTGLDLPDTDLAGSPRIYGVAVDLGCYEWNYPVGIDDEPSPAAVQMQTFPNPFVEQLSLVFDLKLPGRLNCDFYNVRGQKVRSIADAPYSKGEHMLIWDGCDNSGRRLGSGVYIMRMRVDGKMISTRKIVMTK